MEYVIDPNTGKGMWTDTTNYAAMANDGQYNADGSTGQGLNFFGEDNKLRFEDYFSTKNASASAADTQLKYKPSGTSDVSSNTAPTPSVSSDLYLDETPKYWQDFGAGGGVVGDSSVAGQALANQTDTGEGFKWGDQDWGMEGLGGTLVGFGQLGQGIASYFENKKTADKQRELLGQQIESNKYALGKAKDYDKALKGFGLKG